MFKNATWLTLALTALLELSSVAARHPRSIWPFSSSEPKEEPLISDKHAEILQKAGLGEYLDLGSHPLWKIHKYEGIDLKPVQVETEIIESSGAQRQSPPELPQLDARNPVSNVAPLTESEQPAQPATELPDLSFLDDLGGYAAFLPDYEDEKANDLAGSIVREEQSHPGFLAKLWSKIWGVGSFFRSNESNEEKELEEAFVQIALPETKQHYAEVKIIAPTQRVAPAVVVQQPAPAVVVQQPVPTVTNQYAFTAGPSVAKPVAKWHRPNTPFSRSQTWFQSWNPNAGYSVQVEGPSEYPAEHVATVMAYTADANNQLQRKVSHDEEEQPQPPQQEEQKEQEEVAVTEGQVQEVAQLESTTAASQIEKRVDVETEAPPKFNLPKGLPKGLMKRLQITDEDVQKVLSDKESAARALDRLRSLQKEYEQRMGHSYPNLRKQIY